MATDGIKIIDGDAAHDTYNGLLKAFEEGATAEDLRAKFLSDREAYFDDFDYEIYITASALALWECGALSESILVEVKGLMSKTVEIWTEEADLKTAKARLKVLERFYSKISTVNTKPRKRKAVKQPGKALYEINDVLAFRMPDDKYCVTIVLDVAYRKNRYTYYLGYVHYKSYKIPNLKEIEQDKILGKKIPIGFENGIPDLSSHLWSPEFHTNGGIQGLMERELAKGVEYKVFLNRIGIEHHHFKKFADKFQKIGNIPFMEECINLGDLEGAISFVHICDSFIRAETYYEDWLKLGYMWFSIGPLRKG